MFETFYNAIANLFYQAKTAFTQIFRSENVQQQSFETFEDLTQSVRMDNETGIFTGKRGEPLVRRSNREGNSR